MLALSFPREKNDNNEAIFKNYNRCSYLGMSCNTFKPLPFLLVLNTSHLAYSRFWKRLFVHRSPNVHLEQLKKFTKTLRQMRVESEQDFLMRHFHWNEYTSKLIEKILRFFILNS